MLCILPTTEMKMSSSPSPLSLSISEEGEARYLAHLHFKKRLLLLLPHSAVLSLSSLSFFMPSWASWPPLGLVPLGERGGGRGRAGIHLRHCMCCAWPQKRDLGRFVAEKWNLFEREKIWQYSYLCSIVKCSRTLLVGTWSVGIGKLGTLRH